MGYRGEDRSRERTAWGAQSPREPSREHAGFGSPGYEGAGYDSAGDDSAGYNGASYDSAGDDSAGYDSDSRASGGYEGAGYGTGSYDTAGYKSAGHDGYAPGDDYQSDGYATDGYSTGRYGTGSHRAESYGTDGYDHASYDSASRDSASYDSASYDSASYDNGYSASGQRTGSYGTGGTGGYSVADYGDYGSDYAAGGHSSQSLHGAPYDGTGYGRDTSYDSASSYDSGTSGHGSSGSGPYPALRHSSGGYPVLEPDANDDGNDWYARSGPIPAGGFADTSAQLAVRDPVRDPIRGYPPEADRQDPGLAATRQQLRYDESDFVTYPGYDGVEDGSRGYDTPRGYDYDDYADQTRLDQVAVDYDAPTGGRGFAPALQGDGFDSGMYRDGYAGPSELDGTRGGPGTGPQRVPGGGKKPKKQKKAATRNQAGQPKRGRRALVLTTATIVVVAALGYAGYAGYHVWSKSKANNQEAAISQPLPSVLPSSANQQCATQFGGPFCHIQMRTDDPTPLTTAELYPHTVYNESSKIGFLLAATNLDTDCTKAVYGSDFMKQLKTGQCNQALRASYISDDKTMMGTIGVFNLVSTNEAHYAAKLVGTQNFVVPLKSANSIISKLGDAVGAIETQYKGHYLIVTWSQLANGKNPTTAQTQQLLDFDSALLASTANGYLTQRMVNGDGSTATPSATSSATPGATSSATPTATSSGR